VARGATVISPVATERWFSRLGAPLGGEDANAAAGYLAVLGLPVSTPIAVAADWAEAERITRGPQAGAGWWTREEAERRTLMQETTARIGEQLLLQTLTDAVEGYAQATYACAARSCGGDETLARVASGAALMAVHCRALALLAGRGEDHLFMQKYALFARGRWPLGMRDSTFTLF
jgi:hypothetical protein